MENQNLVVELRSILEPLDLAELFPKRQPLEVELGCGDASFLVEYARRHPQKNFIGVERLLGRIQKLHRKGHRLGLGNLRGVRIESSYFLEYLLPPHSVAAIHLYFPDPWPKKRHHKNRLVNEMFPQMIKNALIPAGVVYLRTDHPDYFSEMLGIFGADNHFREIETPIELAEIRTDFERDFNAKGIATLRAAYQWMP
ncbi:MAG TPA: tRNA (guanosine(46)-N7)-methyltransferase TrmB [Verrucomicrobiae bacterium]|nr:tRNA (guanosine(46)-N7)-methyltransferase TrmB [Verrucomicrobiae bacterium]